MLMVRVGPLCEEVALAAVPNVSAMAECDGKPIKTPDKKSQPMACTTPCVGIRGENAECTDPMLQVAVDPQPDRPAGLAGLTHAPATPPPQAA